MLLNAALATIVAVLGVFIALVLSPWNSASLYTTEDIDTTAAVVREKVRRAATLLKHVLSNLSLSYANDLQPVLELLSPTTLDK